LSEIPVSLRVNPTYWETLTILAGDSASARLLEGFGLSVRRVFDDAPAAVHRDAAHKMKHWMCRWALREFGEFLWVDWDTVLLREPDDSFWSWCRHRGTPKFVQIPNYWATVNCGVYYASSNWLGQMEHSFEAQVAKPNDELLWASVLPADIHNRPEFWWGQRVPNIWTPDEFGAVNSATYFAHVRHLEWAKELRGRCA